MPPNPTHGKAAGERTVFVPTDEDLKDLNASLSSLPAPNVWLVFDASIRQKQIQDDSESRISSTIKVELPSEAKEILHKYWGYLFTIRRDTDLYEIVQAKNDAGKVLAKIEIDAPEGKRKIAWDEAEELLQFVIESFRNLRKEVNKSRE